MVGDNVVSEGVVGGVVGGGVARPNDECKRRLGEPCTSCTTFGVAAVMIAEYTSVELADGASS